MSVILFIHLSLKKRDERRGEEGEGLRKLIQPQHCLLSIVYVYSLGTSASWPNILSRIPKYISSTSALFANGLLIFRGASYGLKNLGVL